MLIFFSLLQTLSTADEALLKMDVWSNSIKLEEILIFFSLLQTPSTADLAI